MLSFKHHTTHIAVGASSSRPLDPATFKRAKKKTDTIMSPIAAASLPEYLTAQETSLRSQPPLSSLLNRPSCLQKQINTRRSFFFFFKNPLVVESSPHSHLQAVLSNPRSLCDASNHPTQHARALSISLPLPATVARAPKNPKNQSSEEKKKSPRARAVG